ncbi:MAG TPA: DUF1570 domain-containing protein [Gemmataceae bacterium]|nr:DUF1570 domain-containing protein [Gemmataceae bacterium]
MTHATRQLAAGRTWRPLALGVCLLALASCHAFKVATLGDKPDRFDKEPPPTAPGKQSLRVGQFVFLADFKIKEDQAIFRELGELPEQVRKDLKLPDSDKLVYVYLFEDRARYQRYLKQKQPKLPERRAFFVVQPRPMGGEEDLIVYTYWSDRIQQDLRHELTHALLHSVINVVPIWLDEGLAEYYELPPQRNGVNSAHVEVLRRGPGGAAVPDLARLEGLTEVEQMTRAEYREAWAWVHLMLHGKPEAKAALLDYLQYLRPLRPNARPKPLRPQLAAVYPSPEQALEQHLGQLDAGIQAAARR